jgi:hypothetical protein
VRRCILVILAALAALPAWVAFGETFKLANGDTLTGELLLASANDQGIQIKVGDGKYERVPWANFSQEDLKRFSQNPKLEPLVEPLIEITAEERIKKTEVDIKQPERLQRAASHSLFGAMFSSGLGMFIVLLLYAANIYAGYEVALFRAQPVPLVCGVSAVAPLIGPIVFLAMKTRLKEAETPLEAAVAEAMAPDQAAAADDANPMKVDGAQAPTLKMHVEEEPAPSPESKIEVFQRGQYTFNRRFIETRFAGFFGMVRREDTRNLVLHMKTMRGEFDGERITRIAANDLHLQVHKGHATEEIMIPFQEIQEIRLQPRKA